MKQTNQSGFTLIELVIVIVILGILAVTAAPKFLNIQGDARTSVVQGLEGALKGGVSIVYSKALIQGSTAATGSLSNPTVALVHGYPAATEVALSAILDASLEPASDADTGADWEVVATTATSTDAGFARIYPAGDYEGDSSVTPAVAATACYVQYTEATASTEASVTSVTTGC